MANPPPLVVQSSSQIKANILRTIRNGIIELQGNPAPNVSDKSDFGIIAQGLANEVGVANNNAVILADDGMPDTATGPSLDRLLAIYGLSRRPASPAFGAVDVIGASADIFVPAGQQLSDPSGNLFKVQVGGTYGLTTTVIPVVSVSTGSTTNDPSGTILTWVKTPAYFAPTVVVDATNPITGGQDAEDDDTARARLLKYLQNPPGSGNAAQIIDLAQASSTDVQTAFVYAADRGPGTYDVTVVAYAEYATAQSFSRTIDNFDLNNVITPYILGAMPQYADCYVSTAKSFPFDVSVFLSLPSSPSSIPAGPGGGWLDPSPLSVPQYPGTATSSTPAAIYVVDGYALSGSDPTVPQNTASQFFVYLAIPPAQGYATTTSGQSTATYSLSYVSPSTFVLYSAQTSNITKATAWGSLAAYPNLYNVSLNAPFYRTGSNGPLPGNWVFPTAVNTATYVTNALNYFAAMGPGERTNVAGLIPRALRQPIDPVAYPYRLDTRFLKAIINSGPEVYDATFNIRQPHTRTGVVGGPLITTSYGGTFWDYGQLSAAPFSASDPAYARYAPPTTYNWFGSMQNPTYCFTPGNLGFYASVQ